ncbi:MAG: hypothetical protein AAGF92_12475 [Myxococcota bacterium]
MDAVRVLLLTLFALALPASLAHAGGYEFPGDGTRAIGRGGAFAARADDPMAVVVNPAALGSLPGIQLMASTHLLFAKDCFSRNAPGVDTDGNSTPPEWDAGWGLVDGNRIPYTEVCNAKGKRFTPIPAIGVTWRVSKQVGMGFMIIPPNSERSQRWGNQAYDAPIENSDQTRRYQGYVDAPQGAVSEGSNRQVPLDNGDDLLPSPARYLLVDREVTVVYPTFAVGARPLRWLQIGAAFGWGIADTTFTVNIRNAAAGENPLPVEGQSRLKGQDWFAPRFSAAIHFIPHDNLDIVTVFRWDDTIKVRGPLEVNVPLFDNLAGEPNSLVGTGTLSAPRPWWVTFGIRYAQRIVPRPDDPDAPRRESGRVEDQMSQERWDIELDVVYEKNSVVDNFDILIEDLNTAAGTLPQDINTSVAVQHNWRDQLSIRLGGDWNIRPGVVAIRAGFSYETNGFDGIASRTSKTGTVDFMPGRRFGAHAGVTGRIGKRRYSELSGAFSYFHMQPHQNNNGGVEQVVVDPAGGGSQGPGDIVNNGRFTSRYIVASLMYRHFFQGGRIRGTR